MINPMGLPLFIGMPLDGVKHGITQGAAADLFGLALFGGRRGGLKSVPLGAIHIFLSDMAGAAEFISGSDGRTASAVA
jgi:hypothetical protein